MRSGTYNRVDAVRQVRLLLAQSITAQKRSHQRQADLQAEIARWRERAALADRVGQVALAAEARDKAQAFSEKLEREREQSSWLNRHVADLREKARATEPRASSTRPMIDPDIAEPVSESQKNDARVQAAFQQLELDREIADIRARLRVTTTKH
jgi:phage shock protein A